MTRACATCEWSRETSPSSAVLSCRESPVPQQVFPDHWCGRWRLAELIAGGRDLRTRP